MASRTSPSPPLRCLPVALLVNAIFSLSCVAGPLRLISVMDSGQATPAVAGGDSVAPLLSADGRFVLFASTAKNLVVNSNGNALPGTFPSRWNVFCRNRTNGSTSLVSVNLSGTDGGNDDSFPSGISAGGRFALFESRAGDLVAGDNNQISDIFVRDLSSNLTVLVSIGTNGGPGNGPARSAVITPDGRFVAFVSSANNLVPDDTNGIADVFVRDLQTGQTTLASVGAQSTRSALSPSGSSEAPDISPDGRYVVFYSTATNLVAGVTNVGDIYMRDLVAGTTSWASSGARAAVQAVMGTTNVACYNHMISADGQHVAYQASPIASTNPITAGLILRYGLQSGTTEVVNTNTYVPTTAYEDVHTLDMTPDGRFIAFVANTNGTSGSNSCILLWDGTSGASILVSGDLSGSVPFNSICDWPALDATGQRVAFLSNAGNLTTNPLVGDFHLYLRDVQSGVTTLIDADTNGAGSIISSATAPRLSTNGQLVVFEAPDGNLVPNDRNRDSDIFARDLNTGAIELISAHHPALPSLSPNGLSTLFPSSVSADGRLVAFSSEADNLVPNDTSGFPDVFVRDTVTGTNILVSVATNGAPGDGMSGEPSISADGRFVAFTSRADNLVAGDTNKTLDVFLRDLLNGTTSLVSISTNGGSPGSGPSYLPVLSSNAKYVLFRSSATNLAASGSSPSIENLFLRDMQSGTTYALTLGGVLAAVMTADGRFVFFYGNVSVSLGSPYLYLWDSQLAARVYTNINPGIGSPLAVSPDGNRLAFKYGTQLDMLDRSANTNWAATLPTTPSSARPQFGGDGRFLSFIGSANQVYLQDFLAGTNALISRGVDSANANDVCDSPTISSDGRFVAYRSAASNLVLGDTNGVPDLFLYDRLSGATTLLTVSQLTGLPADNRSLIPIFTADSANLFLQSWASDLVTNDFNLNSDIFGLNLYPSNSVPPFAVQIFPPTLSAGPTLSWPVVPGKTYGVQFKDNLANDWQPANGKITLIGDRGYFTGGSPPAGPRFYRIVVFPP